MPTKSQLQEQLKRERELVKDLNKKYKKLQEAFSKEKANIVINSINEKALKSAESALRYREAMHEGFVEAFDIILDRIRDGEI